jgi:hypothetical protein
MRTRSQKTMEIIEAARKLLDPERPMTLRHLYYLLVSAQILDNSEKSYRRLIQVTSAARKRGELPYDGLVDNARTHIKPSSWSGLADFAEEQADICRKDLWTRQEHYVEVWCEKDAIAGVLSDVTWKYDVHLRPVRGYSSLTFLHQAAREISEIEKPIFVYYLGDHDPSGLDIERSCRSGLMDMVRDAGWTGETIHWKRLALNVSDIEEFGIVPLAAKRKDRRFKQFELEYGTEAAELDALPPEELRRRVRVAIENHIDADEWNKLLGIEELERRSYRLAMKKFGNGRRPASV